MPHIVLADANNKRKETTWADIFSMQNVCFSRDDRKKNSRFCVLRYMHTHRSGPGAGGPCPLASARGGRASGNLPASPQPPPECCVRVGWELGGEVRPSGLPASQAPNLCLSSTLVSLSDGVPEHVVFLSAFCLISRVAYKWWFLFVLF